MRALMYASGDHEAVNTVAKRLELMRRDRYAFRRLVWRQAQLAVEDAAIWRAIGALSESLNELWSDMEDDGGSATMPGATARAIMRRAGARPLALPWRRSKP